MRLSPHSSNIPAPHVAFRLKPEAPSYAFAFRLKPEATSYCIRLPAEAGRHKLLHSPSG